MLVVAFAVVLVVGVVFALAVYPPRKPHWWRHATRPLRRVLRPGHYRW